MQRPLPRHTRAHGDLDTQFLADLADDCLLLGLAGLNLAAGELPAARRPVGLGTPRREVAAIALDGGSDDDGHSTSMPASRQAISAATPASA